MSWRQWACVVLGVVAIAVGMFTLVTVGNEQRATRSKDRTERCTRLCEPRSGMSHWSTIKVGFGSFQVLCVCWDSTETRLP